MARKLSVFGMRESIVKGTHGNVPFTTTVFKFVCSLYSYHTSYFYKKNMTALTVAGRDGILSSSRLHRADICLLRRVDSVRVVFVLLGTKIGLTFQAGYRNWKMNCSHRRERNVKMWVQRNW